MQAKANLKATGAAALMDLTIAEMSVNAVHPTALQVRCEDGT